MGSGLTTGQFSAPAAMKCIRCGGGRVGKSIMTGDGSTCLEGFPGPKTPTSFAHCPN